MDDIELDNINKGREEERLGQDREREETSFTERTEETEDDYNDIRSRINSGSTTQRETNEGLDVGNIPTLPNVGEYKRSVLHAKKEFLERELGVRLRKGAGPKSKELFDNLIITTDSKGKKINGAEYKGKKILILKNKKIEYSENRAYAREIADFKKLLENAKKEYEGTVDAEVDKAAGFPLSDEPSGRVRESVADSLEDLVLDKYDKISQNDLDKNIEREIKGIPNVDKNIDYNNLEDQSEKDQYDAKIAGLKVDTEHWENLEEKEQDPTKKQLYKTAKELCIAKKSYMEVRANQRPESEEALSMIGEETERNDLTRFERFKKWAKENITGVSAIAISVAGIITATVMAGRNAVKKGAKAVGQFGKALANLAKKAGPAIATILNILAQALTWGAKALEFLSRNLWIVALFLTYLVYDTIKNRMRKK